VRKDGLDYDGSLRTNTFANPAGNHPGALLEVTLGRSIRDFKKAMNEAGNPNPPKPTAGEAKPLELNAEIFSSDCN
jgi:hypothetical protein